MSLVETRSSSVSRAPRPSSLADVLDLILDKGLVIDAYVRISLAGIELLTIDARVVVASVDTYLRFAEAVNRLDLTTTESPGIRGLSRDLSSDKGDEEEEDDDSSGSRGSKALSSGQSENGDDEQDESDQEDGGMLHRLAERARFDQ